MLFKVKCFGLLLLRARIVVKDMLQWLGVIQENENIYLIREKSIEDSRHLYFHCARVYRV